MDGRPISEIEAHSLDTKVTTRLGAFYQPVFLALGCWVRYRLLSESAPTGSDSPVP